MKTGVKNYYDDSGYLVISTGDDLYQYEIEMLFQTERQATQTQLAQHSDLPLESENGETHIALDFTALSNPFNLYGIYDAAQVLAVEEGAEGVTPDKPEVVDPEYAITPEDGPIRDVDMNPLVFSLLSTAN